MASNTSPGRAPNRRYPTHELELAAQLPEAIKREAAGRPMKRLLLAQALGLKPASSNFRLWLRSSNKYGLTKGNEKSEFVELTPLGRRIVDDDAQVRAAARREAILAAPVFGDFFRAYDDNRVPSMLEDVLGSSFGVPIEHRAEAANLIKANGRLARIIKEISGSEYVMLRTGVDIAPPPSQDSSAERQSEVFSEVAVNEATQGQPSIPKLGTRSQPEENRRVFLGHGKSGGSVVKQIKTILTFGEFIPVVSVERESFSKAVPEKVLDEMRSCEYGIIHVSPESEVTDESGEVKALLNENVLIEIGAALALYGGRFILLVEDGAVLPSNLQGLYQVRYSGDELGHEGTMKLLSALTAFRESRSSSSDADRESA